LRSQTTRFQRRSTARSAPRAPIAIGAVTIRDGDGVRVIPEAMAARAITHIAQVM
jgi:hypothetical protein